MFVIRTFAAGSGSTRRQALPPMLTATFILAALVLLLSIDDSTSRET
jgi:hypothetical protein